MQRVPKIVSERLRSATVKEHPDADVLTAFSERSLPVQERNGVMEHLSRCAECREIVTLALPEQPVAELRPHRGLGNWLTWPTLRWGFVAAGIVAIASLGVIEYKRQTRPSMVAINSGPGAEGAAKKAENRPEPQPAAADEDKAQPQTTTGVAAPSGPLAGSVKTDTEQKKEFDRLDQFGSTQSAPSSGERAGKAGVGVVIGGPSNGRQLAHGPKMPVQWQQNANTNSLANNEAFSFQSQPVAPPPPAPSAGPSKQLEIHGQAGPAALDAKSADAEKKSEVVDALTLPPSLKVPSSTGRNESEVARAKPAEAAAAPEARTEELSQATTTPYGVSSGELTNFSKSATLTPQSTRWAISAVGALQRSVDQGKNWQDVDVNSSPEVQAGANLQLAMRASRAKAVAKDKGDTIARAAPIVFRAVAANGPDVWAGGSNGALFHSLDAGLHWVRVEPTWSGVLLSGDIVSLQFANTQQGRILTSSNEIWTTADGGQTWQKH